MLLMSAILFFVKFNSKIFGVLNSLEILHRVLLSVRKHGMGKSFTEYGVQQLVKQSKGVNSSMSLLGLPLFVILMEPQLVLLLY